MVNKPKRISLATDEEVANLLEDIVKREKTTMSQVIREAIRSYYVLKTNKAISSEMARSYVELLYGKEHIVLDIEIYGAMLAELNEKASGRFWELVEKVGYEHGLRFKLEGYEDVSEVLKHLEAKNWFGLKIDKDGYYTLVLSIRDEQKIMKTFLGGLFKGLEEPVNIVEGIRKLFVIKKLNRNECAEEVQRCQVV